MNSSQDAKRPRVFIRFVGTLIGVGLLVYLLSRQGWAEIGTAIRQIPLTTFAVACLLIFVSRLSVSVRWYVLLESSGAGLSLMDATKLTFAGLFAANFLPTTIGGDVVRLAGVLRVGQARVAAAASIIVDRLVGMAGMATAAPIGLVKMVAWLVPASAATSCAAPAIASTSTERPTSRGEWLVRWIRRLPRRAADLLGIWLHQPLALLEAYCFTWGHMLSVFLIIWLFLRGMGDGISLWLVAGLWSLTYFVTLLPVSINGLGIQELSTAFIFSQFGGVSASSSLTLGLLIRTLSMLASLPGAFFLPTILSGEHSVREAGTTDSTARS
jgi:uncharacterized membrane protein YbhN (UPF0104 family)